MNKPKKHTTDKKQDLVQEPATVYETEKKSFSEDSEELHPILVKLIEKSKKNHEEGNVFSHEEMMRRVKLKYPFLK
jgi:hypothetical protein